MDSRQLYRNSINSALQDSRQLIVTELISVNLMQLTDWNFDEEVSAMFSVFLLLFNQTKLSYKLLSIVYSINSHHLALDPLLILSWSFKLVTTLPDISDFPSFSWSVNVNVFLLKSDSTHNHLILSEERS